MKGFVKLRITGQDLDFEQINRELSQQPTFSYRKGDSYTPKYGDTTPVIYQEDCWLLEIEKCELESFNDIINQLLSKLKDSSDEIKQLSEKSQITLWISSYPDQEQSNIHLSVNTLNLIAELGIAIDFNVLFLKELYNGNSTQ